MNLVIDSGNTRIKAAVFSEDILKEKKTFSDEIELKSFLSHHTYQNAIVSSVSVDGDKILNAIKAEKKILLNNKLPVPFQNKYSSPETLGVDRIAAVCGAMDLFPSQNCLVIDAGTCITFEFIDENKNYWGGAISPGIKMRFEAMHTFTKRLPLVQAEGELKLIGNSTENCMRSGVLNGVLSEVEGIINQYEKMYSNLKIVLCGGDALFFENNLKHTIFAAPDLVLSGLNRILSHNAAF